MVAEAIEQTMSQRTTAVLAIILAALLVGSYVVSRQQQTKPQPASPTAWPELTDGQINRIYILDTTSGQRLEAHQDTSAGWTLDAPAMGQADAQKLDAWLGQWQFMYVQHTVTPTAGLGEFGLAPPALVVTLTAPAGQRPTAVIHIGQRAPAAAGYYARQPGDEQVVVIGEWLVDETYRLVATPPLAPTVTPTP